MFQSKFLSVQQDVLFPRFMVSPILVTILTAAIAILIGSMLPAVAQQSETSGGSAAGVGSAEDLLQTGGQDPSVSLPAAPSSSQIRSDEQSLDQQEQQDLPNLQETPRAEDQQLLRQDIQQVDRGIPNPGTGSNPQQDSPDQIKIPF